MEIFGFEFENKKEEKLLKDIMEKIEIVNINEFIIKKVIEVRKNIELNYQMQSFLQQQFI